jgi:hypothetical protein
MGLVVAPCLRRTNLKLNYQFSALIEELLQLDVIFDSHSKLNQGDFNIMFEYAASYPREAEESLRASQNRYKSLLGIIGSHLYAIKPLIAQMGISAKASSDGYEYEITIPTKLKELAKEKAIALLSRFDCIDLDWFKYLANTEFCPTFDPKNEKAFDFPSDTKPDQRLSTQRSTTSGKITGFTMYGDLAKAFDCFLRVHRFL